MIGITREDGPSKKRDAAYDLVKQLLMAGQMRPGKHLVVQELADLLQIGVTPLRDALVRLSAEGFLSREDTYGFSTKELRVEEERQILEMCDITLSAGLRIAGDRMSQEVRASLIELHDVPGRTVEDALVLAGRVRDMYLDVGRAAGNEIMVNLSRVLVDRSHLVRMLDLQMEEAGSRTIEDLRTIGIAMSQGDPERAVAATKAILGRRIERLNVLVKEANFIASQATFP